MLRHVLLGFVAGGNLGFPNFNGFFYHTTNGSVPYLRQFASQGGLMIVTSVMTAKHKILYILMLCPAGGLSWTRQVLPGVIPVSLSLYQVLARMIFGIGTRMSTEQIGRRNLAGQCLLHCLTHSLFLPFRQTDTHTQKCDSYDAASLFCFLYAAGIWPHRWPRHSSHPRWTDLCYSVQLRHPFWSATAT